VDLPTLGALAALGSAATWAVTSLLVRTLSPPFTSVGINAFRSTVAGVLLLGWATAGHGLDVFAAVSLPSLLLLGLSIALAIAIGDSVFFESTRILGLGRAMTISMTYPVGAALLAAAFLDEPVTARVAAGTLITLGGLALIVGERPGREGARRRWRGVEERDTGGERGHQIRPERLAQGRDLPLLLLDGLDEQHLQGGMIHPQIPVRALAHELGRDGLDVLGDEPVS